MKTNELIALGYIAGIVVIWKLMQFIFNYESDFYNLITVLILHRLIVLDLEFNDTKQIVKRWFVS